MASVVHIRGKSIDAVATAFALNDALMKALAVVCGDGKAGPNGEGVDAIGIMDDYHLAPYALVQQKERKRKHEDKHRMNYMLLFTGYKVRESHYKACELLSGIKAVRDVSPLWICHLAGGTHDAKQFTRVKEDDWVRFRQYVNSGVCLEMVDFALKEICRVMEIEQPDRETFRALVDSKLDTLHTRLPRVLRRPPRGY